jgi:hypothetical protein
MDVLGKFLFPVRRDSGYQTPLLPLRELSWLEVMPLALMAVAPRPLMVRKLVMEPMSPTVPTLWSLSTFLEQRLRKTRTQLLGQRTKE